MMRKDQLDQQGLLHSWKLGVHMCWTAAQLIVLAATQDTLDSSGHTRDFPKQGA